MIHENLHSYFPPTIRDHEQELAVGYLRAMDEPPLYAKLNSGATVYRLLWLRMDDVPGSPPAQCIRIQQISADKGAEIAVKKTEATQEWLPRQFILTKQEELPPGVLSNLTTDYERLGFWKTPSNEGLPFNGDRWIFEALDQDRYHVVLRRSLEASIAATRDRSWMEKLRPGAVAIIERDLPLGELATYMLQLASIEF